MRYRQQIKLIRNLEKRLTNRNKKRIERIFLKFTKKIKIDNKQKFNDEIKIVVNIDYAYLENKLKDALEVIYLYNFDEVVGTFKNLYKKRLNEKVIKGVRDYFLESWNKENAMKKATRMSNTTRNILNKVIIEAQQKGLSHDDLVKELMSKGKNMSKQRASTIARTETSNSINNVSYKLSKNAGMKKKGWIHIGGHKSYRINHKKLDNKWIDIDELWNLGNKIYAKCPHDTNLPASQVVRCSCLQIYK